MLTVQSSVITFPSINQEQRYAKTPDERTEGVDLSTEDIRLKWLVDNTGKRVSARTNYQHIAMVSDLSDAAYRVLCLLTSFSSGDLKQIYPRVDQICEILGKSRAAVMRAIKELGDSGWIDAGRRGPRSAERNFSIPAQALKGITDEVIQLLDVSNLRLHSENDVSKMSTISDEKPFKKRNSKKQESKEEEIGLKNETCFQHDLQPEGGEEGKRGLKFETSFPKEVSNLRHAYKPIQDLRSNLGKKEKNHPGEDYVKFSAHEEEASPAPGDLNSGNGRMITATAAGLASALAAVFPAAASIPPERPAIEESCWPLKAQQAAFLNPQEALAQREVRISHTGRIEVFGAFKSELEELFPLVDMTAGLAAAEPNVNLSFGAISAMQQIRRQFGYMQQRASTSRQNYERAVADRKNQECEPGYMIQKIGGFNIKVRK